MTRRNRIEWIRVPENALQGSSDLAYLVGAEDAFEHTRLLPGEQVAWCQTDKVAFHLETWQFLLAQNHGCCCICGKRGTIQIVTLPDLPLKNPPEIHQQPKEYGQTTLIGLNQIKNFIGRAKVVQDYVHEVYQTRSTGAVYIRFESRAPNDPPFKGFKAVIRPRYLKAWLAAGIYPSIYQHQVVRVRGIIQKHPTWGLEILINSPRVIRSI